MTLSYKFQLALVPETNGYCLSGAIKSKCKKGAGRRAGGRIDLVFVGKWVGIWRRCWLRDEEGFRIINLLDRWLRAEIQGTINECGRWGFVLSNCRNLFCQENSRIVIVICKSLVCDGTRMGFLLQFHVYNAELCVRLFVGIIDYRDLFPGEIKQRSNGKRFQFTNYFVN